MTPTLDSISSTSHFPQSSGPYKRGRATKKAKSLPINHGTRPPSLIQNRLVPCGAATSTNPGKQKLAEEWLIRLKTYQMFASRGFRQISWVHWCYQRATKQISQYFVGDSVFSVFCIKHITEIASQAPLGLDLPPLPILAFSFQGIGHRLLMLSLEWGLEGKWTRLDPPLSSNLPILH